MDLSNDLISQFVKVTNDGDVGSKESTVYGTTVEYNGEMYVKIDGSDLLTPVETTSDMQTGERVTVMIKNHAATVTGNLTSPSANEGTVSKKVTEAVDGIEGKVITEVEILIADRVSTEQLDAELARIDTLIAGKATIEELEAIDAKIENLEVGNLEAVNAKIENLEATDARIENLVTENLKATNAQIEILDAEVASIQTLVNGNLTSDNILSFHITADKVTMADAFISDAMIANVSAGKISSGSINTSLVSVQSEDGGLVINGSTQQFKDKDGNVRIQIGKDATGDFTFALYGTDGQGQLINQNGITASAIADGLIVNDMVSDNAAISGDKLNISSVITEINSDNSTTIKSNKIYLNEQGQSLEVAFNSLKSQVETIQDVTIDGDLSSVIEQVTSNTTEINVCKEGINTLVAEDTIIKESVTDLNGNIVEVNKTLTSKYAALEQSVNGFKTEVANTYTTKGELNGLEIGANNLVRNSSFLQGSDYWTLGTNVSIDTTTTPYPSALSKQSGLTSDSWRGVVSTHLPNGYLSAAKGDEYTLSCYYYVAPNTTVDVAIALELKARNASNAYVYPLTVILESDKIVTGKWTRISVTKKLSEDIHEGFVQAYVTRNGTVWFNRFQLEKGNKLTSWRVAAEDLQTQIDDTNNNLKTNYSTTETMNSAINQSATNIKSEVSKTYATKSSVTDLEGTLLSDYSTTVDMNSAIDQSATNIKSEVSKTYQTKSSMSDYPTTTQMQSAIDQSASNITSTVSKTYATQTDLTTVEQTADKISWVVKSGTSSSNMTLTDKVYSLVSSNINLTADHIDLHGYVTANNGFSIDTAGNMTAQNGTFSGNITGSTFSSANDVFQVLDDGTVNSDYLVINQEISTQELNVDTINNREYPKVMYRATTVYINQSGTDSTEFYHGATFTSIDALISVAPRNLNGYNLNINLQSNYQGNISLSYFHSGQVNINFCGYTVYGYVYCYGNSAVYRLYGDTANTTNQGIYGKIMPSSGMSMSSYYYAAAFNYCTWSMTDIELYPDTAHTTDSSGICCERGMGAIYRVVAKGNMRYLLRANYHGYVYVSATSGTCNNATFCATTGSTICLNKDVTQAGRNNTSGNPYWSGSGGEVRYEGVTFSGTVSSGSNTNTGATTTKSMVLVGKANTYRSTVYNSWKNDSTARQGDWGYGDCTGCWFFGDAFEDFKNKNVTKIVIEFSRQSGGYNSAVAHKLYTHNHESKPSGAPTLGTSLGTVSVAVGGTAQLAITSSSLISAIKSAKGIAIRNTYSAAYYSVCSSGMRVIVYYKE